MTRLKRQDFFDDGKAT